MKSFKDKRKWVCGRFSFHLLSSYIYCRGFLKFRTPSFKWTDRSHFTSQNTEPFQWKYRFSKYWRFICVKMHEAVRKGLGGHGKFGLFNLYLKTGTKEFCMHNVKQNAFLVILLWPTDIIVSYSRHDIHIYLTLFCMLIIFSFITKIKQEQLVNETPEETYLSIL